jgi:hypothetical protein
MTGDQHFLTRVIRDHLSNEIIDVTGVIGRVLVNGNYG